MAPSKIVKYGTAEAKKWWAFQPVQKPAVPEDKDAFWAHGDIDKFLLAGLEAKGLKPVGDADKPTLLRRVYFDLVGLPPTPQQIDAFLKDASPDAFHRVVDRLPPSPQFGERWGRAIGSMSHAAENRAAKTPTSPFHRRVALPRLRHRRVQCRQALRPIPARANRRRPAARQRRQRKSLPFGRHGLSRHRLEIAHRAKSAAVLPRSRRRANRLPFPGHARPHRRLRALPRS